MAKTLVQGSFGTYPSTPYTAPSTKYARITVLYFAGKDTSGAEPTVLNATSRNPIMGINDARIIAGAYPYSGYHDNSNSSYSYTNAGLQDNSFLVPPGAGVKLVPGDWYGPKYVTYSFLIEEIAKTTVEA